MANRALVVSEPVYRPEPFVPGRHYVNAALADLPDIIRYYLADTDEREQIVEQAHRFVTQEHTMRRWLLRVLTLLEQRLDRRSLASG